MTPNKKIKKSFKPLLFFLISAFFHIIVILLLLKQKHWYHYPRPISVLITLDQEKTFDQKVLEEKKDKQLNKAEEKIKEEQKLPPAKLSPRQSKFGVLWANESEIIPEIMPAHQDIQQELAHPEELSNSILKNTKTSPDKHEDTSRQEIITTTKKSSLKPIPQEETILTTNTNLSPSLDTQSTTTMLNNLSDDQTQNLLAEYNALEQKLKQSDEQKTKNDDNKKQIPPQKKELAENASLLDRIKSAMGDEIAPPPITKKSVPQKFVYQSTPSPLTSQPKNKKNLIAMTQGFIENIKNTGSDWLEQDGVERALTNDELKYISYEQQVSWFLQASWKRHFANATHLTGKLNVRFLLDAQGNVSNVRIINSSGNTFLDDMVIKSIKIASPFPPLPKYFEKTEYQVSRNIHVS